MEQFKYTYFALNKPFLDLFTQETPNLTVPESTCSSEYLVTSKDSVCSEAEKPLLSCSYSKHFEPLKINEKHSLEVYVQSTQHKKTLEPLVISQYLYCAPPVVPGYFISEHQVKNQHLSIAAVSNYSVHNKLYTEIEFHEAIPFRDSVTSEGFTGRSNTTTVDSDMFQFMEDEDGFELNRFTEEIDEFFICEICRKVVRKPRECNSCQNLFCKSCIDLKNTCPSGCFDFKPVNPSKFAMLVYSRLKLKCKNHSNGCEYFSKIKEVCEHEKNCCFEKVKCSSPVCDVYFVNSQKTQENPVCSELCSTVMLFQKVLREKPQQQVLQEFSNYLTKAKEIIQEEVEHEVSPLILELQNKTKQLENYRSNKRAIYRELNERRYKHHPGKWNSTVKKWSCCESLDMSAVGCKNLN